MGESGTFKEIMEQIMELEGSALMAEAAILAQDPAAAVPESLNQKCLNLIDSHFRTGNTAEK